jgi:hypothetical protein
MPASTVLSVLGHVLVLFFPLVAMSRAAPRDLVSVSGLVRSKNGASGDGNRLARCHFLLAPLRRRRHSMAGVPAHSSGRLGSDEQLSTKSERPLLRPGCGAATCILSTPDLEHQKRTASQVLTSCPVRNCKSHGTNPTPLFVVN